MSSKRFHCGLDEAGYGPKLGPLVVARTWILREEGRPPAGRDQESAMQRALKGYVDSKRMYRSGKLRPLEVAALAASTVVRGTVPQSLNDFLGELPKGMEDYPWYAEAAVGQLPLVASVGDVEEAACALGEGLNQEGLVLHGVAPAPLLVAEFNQRVEATDNKAAVEMQLLAGLLQAPLTSGESGVVRCDRLGGRLDYDGWIAGQLPFWQLETEERSRDRSAYSTRSKSRQVRWEFLVKGEDRAPEIAMASCLAKYTREVFMHHFNGYWSKLEPEVAPTAGYPQDAGRWLSEMEKHPVVREHYHRLVRIR